MMDRTTRGSLTEKLLRHKDRSRYLMFFALIALVLMSYVEHQLRLDAITMTVPDVELDCHYDGGGAHVHTADCYDAAGDLVCPLPERELHTHDASCYAADGSLVCGKDELTTAHVHGPGCFRAVPGSEREGTSAMRDSVAFRSNQFSAYAIVLYESLTSGVITADGRQYTVTVSYGEDAQIPEGAQLKVSEYREAGRAWTNYVDQIADELGEDVGYARLFDISIMADGEKIQPQAPVSVEITLADGNQLSGDAKAIHFGDDGIEVLDASVEGETVAFDATGFSVYAIVDAPEPLDVGIVTATGLQQLVSNADKGFCISHKRGDTEYYMTSALKGGGCFEEVTNVQNASTWYLEPTGDGTDGLFRIYTQTDAGKGYLVNTKGNELGLASSGGIVFQMSDAGSGRFYVKDNSQSKWLQHSNSGGGTRLFTDKNNRENSSLAFTLASSLVMSDDPYGLDGTTYGIAYHKESITAAALMANALSDTKLVGQDMLVKPDILDNDGILLVAENATLSEWTFTCVGEDRYHITAADGRYLTISGNKLTLQSEPTEGSSIKVVPGTGANAGKYHLSMNGWALCLPGSAAQGFSTTSSSGDNSWVNLVSKSSELTDDDFVMYSARKVSVSDEDVATGAQVILYTRVWNEQALRYDFYAVDHDGSLIPVYESGDMIEWIGGSINKAAWSFTDYLSNGTSTYYYELQNASSKQYLAPQLKNGQILADSPLGINMNGRRYGDDYTTIIAWDDPHYEFAGLKVEGNRIVSCPLAQAGDFYFAIVEPADVDQLTTVDTIDSKQFGITMKMVDFNNGKGDRDAVQNPFFGGNTNAAGLLSTSLAEDGYPTTTSLTGHTDSLSKLFTGMQEVNKLFLRSAYEESGYFMYDSTQNFAHLDTETGEFTVYDQLGAIGTANGPTRVHGQFMPYNDLQPGVYSTVTNQTDVLQNELPDTDPRKGERMYLITGNQADYFFGMEMEASFTQTPSGLDAWGHDIIFEFSGDDDFWLYVDGELVLDLGGIHSASVGNINFRTGAVQVDVRKAGTGQDRKENTTLRALFEKNYRALHPKAKDAEVTKYLDSIFVEGGTVFKDYTIHTMKMFYMERGAGASNLKMRFNLAAAKPGTVVLSKTISGTDRADYDLAEFPYQVWYKSKTDGEKIEHLLGETDEATGAYNVTYSGKSVPAPFEGEYTPAGGSTSYENVFFLKATQSVDIKLPEDAVSYRIVECGINPGIYDEVKINGAAAEGVSSENASREDYGTPWWTIAEVPRVTYDNHVSPNALRSLSVTKRLYDADGTTLVTDDPTGFTFRLYLASETGDLALADIYPYHVKNADGAYCVWDSATQAFSSLGKSAWEDLTDAERERATFKTSINGSIARIPATYTVEVRDLLVGAQFKVEERASDIPAGYILRPEDGYTRVEGSYLTEEGEQPNQGTIRDNSDPAIEVHNQRGWGLTARKEWSDATFMEAHDTVFLAVYLRGEGGALTLLDGSVRALADGATSAYWFFEALKPGVGFADYVVREVTLAGTYEVADDGTVTGAPKVTPVDNGGAVTVGATPQGERRASEFTYNVSYAPGKVTGGNANVRTDVVSNTREGIKLVKTDWFGNPLAGATFALTSGSKGTTYGAGTYTSDETGLVTIAYLPNGTYTLTEVTAPDGYQGLTGPVTLKVRSGELTFEGHEHDTALCCYEVPVDDMPTLTVRNKAVSLRVLKKGEGNLPLEGAHFALYHQVEDGTHALRRDYNAISGFEDLVTGENGLIHGLTEALEPGSYYLVETKAPDDYKKISDLLFTVGENGVITVEQGTAASAQWTLSVDELTAGDLQYTITITDDKASRKVSFRKVDVDKWDTVTLEGAVFDLYGTTNGARSGEALYAGLRSGSDGLLRDAEDASVFTLPVGEYQLVETEAPAGYNLKAEPVTVRVTGSGVAYDEHTSLSAGADGTSYDAKTGVYTLLVSNSTGYELPSTGGPGVAWVYGAGAVVLACNLLLRKLRA